MIEIKEVKLRSVLQEGRDNGMGFAFLKDCGNNSYETVQPISPCKDYLNEPVFTEITGLPTKAYGLFYEKKLDLFTNDYGYMVITIQKSKTDDYSYSSSFKTDVKNLSDNYSNLQVFINEFENRLKFKNKTTIQKANNEQYLVTLPVEWCCSPKAISLYSLLLRCSVYYKDGDILDYLKLFDNIQDKYLVKQMLGKLDIILKTGKLPEMDKFDEEAAKNFKWSPHNAGICSWNMKYKEDEALVLEAK